MANPDPQLAKLLQWSIEAANPSAQNGTSTSTTTDSSTTGPALRGAPAEALASLLNNQPSDADLMKASMAAAQNPSAPLDVRLTALDNLEQLLESLDNAANLAPLGLWPPLVGLLKDGKAEVRRVAAWCVGTAVQNERRTQEKALAEGALPVLVEMARGDEDAGARQKARRAVSSAVRNFQPGLNELLKALGKEQKGGKEVSAGDMDAVDKVIGELET